MNPLNVHDARYKDVLLNNNIYAYTIIKKTKNKNY